MRRLFVLTAVTALVLDQASKLLVQELLTGHVSHRLVGDFMRLSPTLNDRGLFGMNYGPRFSYFILPLAGIGLVIYFALRNRSRLQALACGMTLAGAFGNLVDRVRVGSVIDFIDVGLPGWRWYTFNLADAFLVCGIILLLACELFMRGKPAAEPPSAVAAEPGELPAEGRPL